MLKQIPIDEALRRVIAGERVPCMVPMTEDSDWADHQPQMLNDILDGVIAFGDEPLQAEEKTTQRKTDTGKLYALADAGWTPAKIADELGVSEQNVRNWLNKREEKK